MFGFPITDLIRKDSSIDAEVIAKDEQGTRIAEDSHHQPQRYSKVPRQCGADQLEVSLIEGTSSIESYRLKATTGETN